MQRGGQPPCAPGEPAGCRGASNGTNAASNYTKRDHPFLELLSELDELAQVILLMLSNQRWQWLFHGRHQLKEELPCG
jgi:hypothetical protein